MSTAFLEQYTTANLYEEVLENKLGLEYFHEALQNKRLNDTLVGKERPDGLRLSTDCPVRRVKEYFDPWYKTPFDDGIAARGFMVESLIEAWLQIDGLKYQTQVPLDYGLGETAFDFILPDSNIVISVKSSKEGFAKPSAANIRQETRMLYHAKLKGLVTDTTLVTWCMVSVSTLRAYSYTTSVGELDLATAENEHAGVVNAYTYYQEQQNAGKKVEQFTGWDDPHFWKTKFGLESRSNPFKQPEIDATGHVENLITTYHHIAAKLKPLEAQQKAVKDELKPIVLERLKTLGETTGTVKAWSKPYNLQIDKRGAFILRARKEK